MYAVILNNAPDTWDKSDDKTTRRQFQLSPYSDEYKQIAHEVRNALNYSVDVENMTIHRNQNIHDLGQMLIKEQKLFVDDPHTTYYKGRRYIKIGKQYKQQALEHNLDFRRCGLSDLEFRKKLSKPTYDELLIVVQCILINEDQEYITPEWSDEYYIEYIVEFN